MIWNSMSNDDTFSCIYKNKLSDDEISSTW